MYNFANPLCPETQRGNFYKINIAYKLTATFTLDAICNIAGAILIALK